MTVRDTDVVPHGEEAVGVRRSVDRSDDLRRRGYAYVDHLKPPPPIRDKDVATRNRHAIGKPRCVDRSSTVDEISEVNAIGRTVGRDRRAGVIRAGRQSEPEAHG